jgi:hypothetical protein
VPRNSAAGVEVNSELHTHIGSEWTQGRFGYADDERTLDIARDGISLIELHPPRNVTLVFNF